MTVFIATIQLNDWETESEIVGVYSTKEKAEQAILEEIQDREEETYLSLEIYDSMNPKHFWEVSPFELDR